MAKKFGKVLLFTAAVGTAAAAVCYFLRRKEHSLEVAEEEDYDDFSDDLDESSDSARSYVPLNTETAEPPAAGDGSGQETSEGSGEKGAFTPLTEQVAQTMEKAEETVEEFFDEDDDSAQEPPIKDQ